MRVKTFRRLIIVGVVGSLVIGIFFKLCARHGSSHEDGYSVGTLINIRNEGVIWAKPAATLLHSGEMNGDEFALDDGLFADAKSFADHGTRVRVEYVHRYLCWAWNYSSCNIITKIDGDVVDVKKPTD